MSKQKARKALARIEKHALRFEKALPPQDTLWLKRLFEVIGELQAELEPQRCPNPDCPHQE